MIVMLLVFRFGIVQHQFQLRDMWFVASRLAERA
jgi:hypothetical protein